jgi:hypothetical protein
VKNLAVKILSVVAVLTAGAAALNYFTREPSVNGRSLSEWLDINAINRTTGRDNSDVTNAVRAIGAKAIPDSRSP